MKKLLVIGLAVLMVLGLTTAALTNWPSETLVNTHTVTWNGSGFISETFSVAGAGSSYFESQGYSGFSGTFTGSYYEGNSPYGFSPPVPPPLIAAKLIANVADGWIEFYVDRTGPNPLYGNFSAPGGERSYNYIEVWDGTGALAMQTFTNEAWTPMQDENGGVPNLGGHYAANFWANTTTDWTPTSGYYMQKTVRASDGDNVNIIATGAGEAYLATHFSHMTPGEVYANTFDGGSGSDRFEALTGPGTFSLEGTGDNRVIKDYGFAFSGAIVAFSTNNSTDSVHFGLSYIYNDNLGANANIRIYTPSGWTDGFTFTDTKMTAK